MTPNFVKSLIYPIQDTEAKKSTRNKTNIGLGHPYVKSLVGRPPVARSAEQVSNLKNPANSKPNTKKLDYELGA
jgi:hypothetical protein